MQLESMFKDADPLIAQTLNDALDEKDVSYKQAAVLYDADGQDFHMIGMTADMLRKKSIGNNVTYVINRNINFTNVCIKQCGFCAFSRDFRQDEGYFLPTEEIVRRAKEAYSFGATEVCIQAGLPPDMDAGLYEGICKAIKDEIPDIHIHGFSPEEVLYGATRSGVSIREYLGRLKDAGVDTLPGTSAEILDQDMRDTISPGRISVRDWTEVIKTAHKMGINTTSTMMFGHIESAQDRTRHISIIRDIQKETGGFTEFVPLNFIHSEAPMYKHQTHEGIRDGASARDVLLTHAVSRIMLNGHIDNIQMSWVKEGQRMAQILLMWGVNDFGGTLINESISTSAGSGHGQMLRPMDIKRMAREMGRIPAQRDTTYNILKEFKDGKNDALDEANPERFGSYFDLIKIDKYRYANRRK